MDEPLQYYHLLSDFEPKLELPNLRAKYSVAAGLRYLNYKGHNSDWAVTIEPEYHPHTPIKVMIRMHKSGKGTLCILSKPSTHEWLRPGHLTAAAKKRHWFLTDISFWNGFPLRQSGGMPRHNALRLRCPQSGLADGLLIIFHERDFTNLLDLMCKSDQTVLQSHAKGMFNLFFPTTALSICLGHLVRNGLYHVSNLQSRPPYQAVNAAQWINGFERNTGKTHGLD